jgi:hypothetical protein
MSLRTVSCSRARSESLDCGLSAFAVSLRSVSVTDLEPLTVGGDRDIQGAAGHEPASIEIVGVAPGRIAADASARLGRGRAAHAAGRYSRFGVVSV